MRGQYPGWSSLLTDVSQATASWRARDQLCREPRRVSGPPTCAALPNGNSLASSSPLSLICGPQCTAVSDLPAIEHLHPALASRAIPPWLQIARQRAPAFALLGRRCVSSVQAPNAWSTSCAHPSRRMRPVRGQLIGEWLWSLGFLMAGVPGRSRGVR